MNHVVIANAIISSPFDEPDRRFRFIDEGITDESVHSPRPGSYFAEVLKKYGDARIEKAHPIQTLRG